MNPPESMLPEPSDKNGCATGATKGAKPTAETGTQADDSDKKIIEAINPLALGLGLKPDEFSTASLSAGDVIEAIGYAITQLKNERDAALAKLAQREAEVEQLYHINDACIELENQLRAALERAAKAAAILKESHA